MKRFFLVLFVLIASNAQATVHTKFSHDDQRRAIKILKKVAKKEGVDENLLVSICFKESSLDQGAFSTDGKSHGLCQITRIAMEDNKFFGNISQLYNPWFNAKMAAMTIKKCQEAFDESDLTIACYNMGRYGVRRYLRGHSLGSVESLDYVMKVNRNMEGGWKMLERKLSN